MGLILLASGTFRERGCWKCSRSFRQVCIWFQVWTFWIWGYSMIIHDCQHKIIAESPRKDRAVGNPTAKSNFRNYWSLCTRDLGAVSNHRCPSNGHNTSAGLLAQSPRVHVNKVSIHRKQAHDISRWRLTDYFRLMESDAVKFRKQKRFWRKRFWVAGVMDMLTCDQHDKWKRFGLWLHLGLDPYGGHLAWLKIWWTNQNPWLITSYYIEAGCKIGGKALATISFPQFSIYRNFH